MAYQISNIWLHGKDAKREKDSFAYRLYPTHGCMGRMHVVEKMLLLI
jgi:hypothetical protein